MNQKTKLSTRQLQGKRVVIDGKPVLIVEEGVSGIMQTWRPKDIFTPIHSQINNTTK